ncbi:prolyl 4-hydroxylase subunit alpha-3 [Staphylotrichum tortipilum]|uniref:Prolyl 4-hydroxylase subunit alpha-3 n=1 Tax=Staphylotrichum tortipilum TaxID=2831512 RepID=A0AAN6MB84_9PEZI|nr:prolyl 4-hydroxylase subunit alpha-3 [Staphylotrichum longicolle]
MITYLLALLPVLFFFADPLSQLFSSSCERPVPPLRRLPRPRLNTDLVALEADNYTCDPHAYQVHVYSRAPLVLYVENFLSVEERKHLLEISEPLYTPSTITHNGGDSTSHTPSIRNSEVALIPRTTLVRCIEDRARALQGWQREVWIERLRVQRYRAGGHYAHHFDWSSGRGGWGRVGSFMVWVEDQEEGGDGERLEGGGTEFPRLRGAREGRWCEFVECPGQGEGEGEGGDGGEGGGDGEGKKGVVFKVMPGNAVYWENFMADGTGRGYDETWHAGLPVTKGVKVGLNIWSTGRIE